MEPFDIILFSSKNEAAAFYCTLLMKILKF